MRTRLGTCATAALPGLRVIGLTYVGLAGMLAVVFVVAAGVTPVAPTLQQVAEPARQAVSDLVQPTSHAVAGLLGGPTVLAANVPQTRPLSISVSVDAEPQEVDSEAEQPSPLAVAPPEVPSLVVVASLPLRIVAARGPASGCGRGTCRRRRG